MKEEALKLADELDTIKYQNGSNPFKPQADMIRKLVAELDKAEPAILDAFNSGKGVGYVDGMKAVKTKPLSDEEINEIYNKIYEMNHTNLVLAFAKAIEKAHGIK